MILRDGLTPVAARMQLGLAASVMVNHVLQSQWVLVSPCDPLTIGGAPVVLFVVALVARQIPRGGARNTQSDAAVLCLLFHLRSSLFIGGRGFPNPVSSNCMLPVACTIAGSDSAGGSLCRDQLPGRYAFLRLVETRSREQGDGAAALLNHADSVVVRIHNEQVPVPVYRHTVRR